MTHAFGWCLDSQHAKPDGSGCPGVIGGADGIACSCPCHSDIALQVRGNGLDTWDNEASPTAGVDAPRPGSNPHSLPKNERG